MKFTQLHTSVSTQLVRGQLCMKYFYPSISTSFKEVESRSDKHTYRSVPFIAYQAFLALHYKMWISSQLAVFEELREFIFSGKQITLMWIHACYDYVSATGLGSVCGSAGWYYLTDDTYISWGLNLWMRAQRAIPFFQEDVRSVIITFL